MKHETNKQLFDAKNQPKKYAPILNELVDWNSPTDPESQSNRKMKNRWRGPYAVTKIYEHPHTVQCTELDLDTGVLNRHTRRDINIGDLRPTLSVAFRNRPRKDWKPNWLP